MGEAHDRRIVLASPYARYGGYRRRWAIGAARRETIPRTQWRRPRFLRSAGDLLLQNRSKDRQVFALPDLSEWDRRSRNAVHRRGSGWRWRRGHSDGGQIRRAFLRKPQGKSRSEKAAREGT